MDKDQPKPNILDLFRELLDDHLGKKEFEEAFKRVFDVVERNKAEFEAIHNAFTALSKQLKNDTSTDLSTFKKELRDAIDASLIDAFQLVTKKLAEVDERVSLLQDGAEGPQGPQGEPGKDGSPDTAEDIRNKLEILEGDERLSIDAIRGLPEELEKIRKQRSNTVYVGGGSASGGRIVKSYDLSDSLNGSLKTFSLPAFWRIISVHTSSSPNALRLTTDYTVDGAAMTITFTSQIDAATTLAAGQTLIVVYAEA